MPEKVRNGSYQNILLEMVDNILFLCAGLAGLEAVGWPPVKAALEAGGFEGRRFGDALPAVRVAARQGNGVGKHAGADGAAERVRAGLAGQIQQELFFPER